MFGGATNIPMSYNRHRASFPRHLGRQIALCVFAMKARRIAAVGGHLGRVLCEVKRGGAGLRVLFCVTKELAMMLGHICRRGSKHALQKSLRPAPSRQTPRV